MSFIEALVVMSVISILTIMFAHGIEVLASRIVL